MIYIGTLIAALVVAGVLALIMKVLFKDREEATKKIKKMDLIYEKLEEEEANAKK